MRALKVRALFSLRPVSKLAYYCVIYPHFNVQSDSWGRNWLCIRFWVLTTHTLIQQFYCVNSLRNRWSMHFQWASDGHRSQHVRSGRGLCWENITLPPQDCVQWMFLSGNALCSRKKHSGTRNIMSSETLLTINLCWLLTIRKVAPIMLAFILTSMSSGTTGLDRKEKHRLLLICCTVIFLAHASIYRNYDDPWWPKSYIFRNFCFLCAASLRDHTINSICKQK